jgi:hypothetical protein
MLYIGFLSGFLIFLLIIRMASFRLQLLKLAEKLPILLSAQPSDFPQLDKQTFDHYDAQLSGLGFEPRFCYAIESVANSKGLVRLYYHPTHRCVATNGQIFQGNTRMAVAFVNSELDDNWLLSTINIKPNSLNCVWIRPRALWNVVPGAEPRDLLDAHLQLRQRMIGSLGVGNVTEDREQQAYFDFSTEIHRRRLEVLRKKNIAILYLEYCFYKRKPIYTWMGDLKKVAINRRVL